MWPEKSQLSLCSVHSDCSFGLGASWRKLSEQENPAWKPNSHTYHSHSPLHTTQNSHTLTHNTKCAHRFTCTHAHAQCGSHTHTHALTHTKTIHSTNTHPPHAHFHTYKHQMFSTHPTITGTPCFCLELGQFSLNPCHCHHHHSINQPLCLSDHHATQLICHKPQTPDSNFKTRFCVQFPSCAFEFKLRIAPFGLLHW